MDAKPGSKQHRQFYALFAKAVYQQAGKQLSLLPQGWRRDDALSNRNRVVFLNDASRKVVLAARGTQLRGPNAAADLGTDALLALNLREVSSRFRNTVRTAKEAVTKYPGFAVTAVGHSLGASQAAWVASKVPGVRAVTFASHTPWKELDSNVLKTAFDADKRVRTEGPKAFADMMREGVQNMFGDRQTSRMKDTVTNYLIPWDPFSTFTYLAGNNFTVKQTEKDPHALANYLA
jgi:hypothetical protein